MARHGLVLILPSLLATYLPRIVVAETQFFFPPPNSTFSYLDTLNVSWTSTTPKVELDLRCEEQDPVVYYAAATANDSALVDLNFDSRAWNSCRFELLDREGIPASSGDWSGTFRIVNSSNAQISEAPRTWGVNISAMATPTPGISSSVAAATPTITPLAASGSGSSNGATSTNGSDAAGTSSVSAATATGNNSPSSLTGGQRAGIGVGVSIAGVLAASAIGFFAIARRRRQKQKETEAGDDSPKMTESPMSETPGAVTGAGVVTYQEAAAEVPVTEMPHYVTVTKIGDGGSQQPSELEGSPRKTVLPAEKPDVKRC